jgi:hypothetical protein
MIVLDPIVDWGWRHGPSAHLMSDLPGRAGTDELLAFARQIGMRPEWLQSGGTEVEHFDVTASRALKAVELGAINIDRRRLVEIIRAKRRAA